MSKGRPWWRTQFKGDLRFLVWAIVLSFVVALGMTVPNYTPRYQVLLFSLGFVITLAVLLRATRKKEDSGALSFPTDRAGKKLME
jgi:membrane protein implicated in regulation of membrane protease activity